MDLSIGQLFMWYGQSQAENRLLNEIIAGLKAQIAELDAEVGELRAVDELKAGVVKLHDED